MTGRAHPPRPKIAMRAPEMELSEAKKTPRFRAAGTTRAAGAILIFLLLAIPGRAAGGENRPAAAANPKTSVQTKIPAKPKKKTPAILKIFSPAADKRRNVPTTVAGVRGIDEPEGAGDSSSRDWTALEKIDHCAISQEELHKFISDGGLK